MKSLLEHAKLISKGCAETENGITMQKVSASGYEKATARH